MMKSSRLEKGFKNRRKIIKDARNLFRLNLQMNWEKLCPNLSFTAENKMGNLCKASHISNLT